MALAASAAILGIARARLFSSPVQGYLSVDDRASCTPYCIKLGIDQRWMRPSIRGSGRNLRQSIFIPLHHPTLMSTPWTPPARIRQPYNKHLHCRSKNWDSSNHFVRHASTSIIRSQRPFSSKLYRLPFREEISLVWLRQALERRQPLHFRSYKVYFI